MALSFSSQVLSSNSADDHDSVSCLLAKETGIICLRAGLTKEAKIQTPCHIVTCLPYVTEPESVREAGRQAGGQGMEAV